MTAATTQVGGLPPRPNKVVGTESDYLHLLVYGKPGCGKTILGATMPGPILFIDCDDGLLSIRTLRPDSPITIEYGIELDNIFSETIGSLQEFINLIRGLRIEFAQDPKRYRGIVLDNLTELQRILMSDRTTNEQAGTMRLPQLQDWGIILIQVQSIVRMLKKLPCHIILLAHEQERNGQTGPALSGRIYEELPGYVDFMFRYSLSTRETQTETGEIVSKSVRALRTAPTEGVNAKSRGDRLNEWEHPNLRKIIAKVTNQT